MWLLTKEVCDRIESAMREGFNFEACASVGCESVAAQPKPERNGQTWVIPVEGVLTEKPDFIAAYFGGGNTLYPDIVKSIAEANADDSVDNIEMRIGNSPGGNVDGLFPTLDAIRDSKKPVRSVVKNLAASATYGLVSQTNHITALSRGTRFGSVGVAYDTLVFTGGGFEEISITNTDSPDKRPDLTTDKGKAVVRNELDEIYELFGGAIADGRGVSLKDVNKKFGKGVVMLAESAKKAGMIDDIQTTASSGTTEEVRSMDLNKLKADHPAVYQEAVAVGKELGAKEERDRVCAHLKLGEQSGAMDVASKAIQDGSGLSMTLQAEYQTASMNKNTMAARIDDNADTTGISPEQSDDTKIAQTVADVVCSGREI